ANRVSSDQAQARLLELEQENLSLRSKIQSYDPKASINIKSLAKGEELFEVHYSYELQFHNSSTKTSFSDSTNLTWNEILSGLAHGLIESGNNHALIKSLSASIFPKVIKEIKAEHGKE